MFDGYSFFSAGAVAMSSTISRTGFKPVRAAGCALRSRFFVDYSFCILAVSVLVRMDVSDFDCSAAYSKGLYHGLQTKVAALLALALLAVRLARRLLMVAARQVQSYTLFCNRAHPGAGDVRVMCVCMCVLLSSRSPLSFKVISLLSVNAVLKVYSPPVIGTSMQFQSYPSVIDTSTRNGEVEGGGVGGAAPQMRHTHIC